MGYACNGCDGAEPAVILLTPLTGGETLAIGQGCMPVTLTGILAATVGIDPESLWRSIERLQRSAKKAQAQNEQNPGTGGTRDNPADDGGDDQPGIRPDAATVHHSEPATVEGPGGSGEGL